MPAPASVSDFIELVLKSGVVEENRLNNYVNQLKSSGNEPPDPSRLAGLMVRDGLLTYFQAEQFLQGKWKRFTIGRYKVLERLGSGGMGQVFLCEHKVMRRRVAVKVLPTAKADDRSSLERFYREARAVAAVDHPNLVRAYDIDQDDNLHFLVMEYVDGTNMQDIIKKHGPMDIIRACHYIYQAAIGLQHAHENGLIHRDIKPGNILVDRSGVVKILDMGLARFFNDEEDNITKRHDESVLGTADYLAPEQAIDSHSVDIRADIYSLGATFYYLLTGSPPFNEGTVAQKLIWHQTRQPRPIKQLRPDVPDALVSVINQMMAKDLRQRYQTPAEVAEALGPWVKTPISVPPAEEMPQLCPAAQGMSFPPASGARPAVQPKTPRPVSRGSMPTINVTETATATPIQPSMTANGSPFSTEPVASTSNWGSIAGLPADVPVAVDNAAYGLDAPKTLSKPKPQTTTKTKFPMWMLLSAVGGFLVVAVGVAVVILMTNRGGSSESNRPEGQKLIVTSKSEKGAFTSISAAIAKAKPGDRIIIADETHKEPSPVRLNKTTLKNLSIEGEGNKPPVISVGNSRDPKALFDLSEIVEGLRIVNLILDCELQYEAGIRVTGKCPGCRFENIEVRRSRKYGISLVNCEAEADRPLTITRLMTARASGSLKDNAGVYVYAGATTGGGLSSKVQIEDCRIESFDIGVILQGSLQDVALRRLRIFNSQSAVSCRRLPANASKADPSIKGLIISACTFHTAQTAGIFFDTGKCVDGSEVLIESNLFANCGTAVRNSGSGLTIKDENNVKDSETKDAGAIKIIPVNEKFPTPDPSNDAQFLRTPKGSPFATAASGRPAGVE